MTKETYKGIKVSSNWDFPHTFKWLCQNSRFIFSHKSYKGERIKVVLNEPIITHNDHPVNMDCFEIGYDRYGVTTVADTVFNAAWGSMIQDSSKEIAEYVREYLIREGATDLVEPPLKAYDGVDL